MNEYKLSQAMNGLPDDLLLEATQIKKKNPVPGRLLRVAACFILMLGVALSSMVLISERRPIEQVSTEPLGPGIAENQPPLLGIQVRTSSGLVELSANMDSPVFGGEKTTNASQIPNPPSDRNLYVYNSITGEWELLEKTAEDLPPRITFVVWMTDYLEEYRPYLVVLKDGVEVDFSSKKETNIRRSFAFLGNTETGWQLTCNFEEQTTLVIQVLDSDSDILLMEQTIVVTPAIYATEESPNGENGVIKNEGYMIEILKEYRISMN